MHDVKWGSQIIIISKARFDGPSLPINRQGVFKDVIDIFVVMSTYIPEFSYGQLHNRCLFVAKNYFKLCFSYSVI